MTEFATLQHATYTEAEWTAWDGVLLEGQIAYSSDVLYSGTDQMRHKVGNGTDTWTALDYVPEPTVFTGGNLTSALNEAKGSDIASASTTDIGAATGNFIHVTGTTTITALGTVQAGTRRIVRFSGALILTHNATSLILPTGANITTAANDVATFVSEGSGNWRCVNYMRASGKSIFDTISQVITNGVTDKAPSEDAVYDALALKQDGILFKQNTTITHTGTLTLTVISSFALPIGFNQANDFVKIWGMAGVDVSGGAVGNNQIRFYIGPNPTDLIGAQHIATMNNTTTLKTYPIGRTMVFKNSLTDFELSATQYDVVQHDYATNANEPTLYSIDFTTQKYFHVAGILYNTGNIISIRSLYAQPLR